MTQKSYNRICEKCGESFQTNNDILCQKCREKWYNFYELHKNDADIPESEAKATFLWDKFIKRVDKEVVQFT
jgi:DNA-directed RNA polymerase subunit M/transcription elongation factor TFIIS